MHVTLTPAWHATAIAIAVGAGTLAGSALVAFVRPQYADVHEAVRLAASIIVLVGLAFTLTSGPSSPAPRRGK